MAVSIDTVYQRVLAIANKEQRGYITPLEFNLLANQAQMDVFEQYFYDKNQNERLPGNDMDYADVADILDEKISVFETSGVITNAINLPTDLYRLGTVILPITAVEIERINVKDLMYILRSPLTRPTDIRPVYIRTGNTVEVYDSLGIVNTDVNCVYVRLPKKVQWGYVVANGKALYNATTSTDFEHHRSDETELVMKILKIAGIVMDKPQVTQVAAQEDIQKLQQEKR